MFHFILFYFVLSFYITLPYSNCITLFAVQYALTAHWFTIWQIRCWYGEISYL